MILNSQPFFVAAILQAFLYTLYLVSLAHVLRRLLYEEEGWILRSRDKIRWGLLTITIVVFIFTTMDLAFEIAILLTFTDNKELNNQIIIASVTIECATLVITDAVLIIRCWLVHQKSWRVIYLPLVLWLVNIICMVNWIVNYTEWVFVSEVPYRERARIFLQLYSTCNFFTNFYASGAIIYQVWRIAKGNRNRQLSILYRICCIAATTGIMYTCTSLPLVVTTYLITTHGGAYALCDALNFSMAGITFNLFLIRIGQLRSELYEMDVDGGTRNVSGSVVLTTVHFGLPTLTTSDTQTHANLEEKIPA
ncbi:hypothetical protein JOM56_005451 [Amanita muscaria]